MPRPRLYVSRSDLGWGPTPASYADPKSGLVIHYDSVDQGLAAAPHAACLDYWRRTRAFHTGPRRRWADLAYSFLCCAHGYVVEGRGLYRQQAAQPGGNSTHYSATLATGPGDPVTPEQIDAVRLLRAWLMEPDTSVAGTVLGHRDFVSTSCPGDTAYALVRDGTFTRPPGAGTEGDDMLGLKRGDRGQRVTLLQQMLLYAGGRLPVHGVDGDYGSETADAVLSVRRSMGSSVTSGDEITGYALAQIHAAVARRQAGAVS
ncbi:N-acetylmuramoyl-L-alanine amidase [Nocardiopsis sp. LOL_012]|uniref:peptidoglycan recognition protein family protein n=1 Tax=Nocardiopsis sp. LOL_012 TaxID=3345409 RepID=UPI003A897000